MGVSKERAQKEVDSFNAYFKKLPLKERKDYYGNKGASIESYRCCGSPEFRKFKDGDCPIGCTVSSAIVEDLDDLYKT